MSSGSSVFSIIPPKRARTERFILLQSPISAFLRQAKCTIVCFLNYVAFNDLDCPYVRLYDVCAQAVSTPKVYRGCEYTSTAKSLPERQIAPIPRKSDGSSSSPNVASILHPFPVNTL